MWLKEAEIATTVVERRPEGQPSWRIQGTKLSVFEMARHASD